MIGNNAREARKAAKLSMQQLADICKCSTSQISRLENSQRNISVSLLQDIATATGKPLFWFFMTPEEQLIWASKSPQAETKKTTETKLNNKDVISSELSLAERQELIAKIAEMIKKISIDTAELVPILIQASR